LDKNAAPDIDQQPDCPTIVESLCMRVVFANFQQWITKLGHFADLGRKCQEFCPVVYRI